MNNTNQKGIMKNYDHLHVCLPHVSLKYRMKEFYFLMCQKKNNLFWMEGFVNVFFVSCIILTKTIVYCDSGHVFNMAAKITFVQLFSNLTFICKKKKCNKIRPDWFFLFNWLQIIQLQFRFFFCFFYCWKLLEFYIKIWIYPENILFLCNIFH